MVKAALRMFEDSLCRCGHSMVLARKPDADLAYRGATWTCPACAAAERARPKDPDAGQHVYVEDVRDTPGAMDLDADDVMWMPDPDAAVTLRSSSVAAAGPVDHERGAADDHPKADAHERDGAPSLAGV